MASAWTENEKGAHIYMILERSWQESRSSLDIWHSYKVEPLNLLRKSETHGKTPDSNHLYKLVPLT